MEFLWIFQVQSDQNGATFPAVGRETAHSERENRPITFFPTEEWFVPTQKYETEAKISLSSPAKTQKSDRESSYLLKKWPLVLRVKLTFHSIFCGNESNDELRIWFDFYYCNDKTPQCE